MIHSFKAKLRETRQCVKLNILKTHTRLKSSKDFKNISHKTRTRTYWETIISEHDWS